MRKLIFTAFVLLGIILAAASSNNPNYTAYAGHVIVGGYCECAPGESRESCIPIECTCGATHTTLPVEKGPTSELPATAMLVAGAGFLWTRVKQSS